MPNPTPTFVLIREETPRDAEAVFAINAAAFGRDDEARLVEALRRDDECLLSLVAEIDGAVVGHVLFHRLPVVNATGERLFEAASLAPLAVLPARQKQGLGSQLVRAGLETLRTRNVPAVIVLGEPHYYGRFGFEHATAARLETPYACPEFQALELIPGSLASLTGRVVYPRAFDSL